MRLTTGDHWIMSVPTSGWTLPATGHCVWARERYSRAGCELWRSSIQSFWRNVALSPISCFTSRTGFRHCTKQPVEIRRTWSISLGWVSGSRYAGGDCEAPGKELVNNIDFMGLDYRGMSDMPYQYGMVADRRGTLYKLIGGYCFNNNYTGWWVITSLPWYFQKLSPWPLTLHRGGGLVCGKEGDNIFEAIKKSFIVH